jgi:hypothetical protein
MRFDNRSAAESTNLVSSRSIRKSPKRFLPMALAGLLVAVAMLSSAQKAECGVTGTLTIVNNSDSDTTFWVMVGGRTVYLQTIQSGYSADIPCNDSPRGATEIGVNGIWQGITGNYGDYTYTFQ